MSGGVDSSVSAYLLLESGFEVLGVTFRFFDGEEDVAAARHVADRLNFKHIEIDLRDEFRKTIIKPFIELYQDGITPNPCVICNRIVKWKNLLRFADEMEIVKVATGHYARVRSDSIRRGADPEKDQSYFLYRLPPEYIRRTVFPVGEFSKTEVRNIASKNGLNLSKRSESTEICFIRNERLEEFLRRNDVPMECGDIVDTSGKIIGKHNGWAKYTIGQRRGLGVASNSGRLYVLEIQPKSNRVVICPKESVMNREFSLVDAVFYTDWPVGEKGGTGIQIRHGGEETPGEVERTGIEKAIVRLSLAVFAPAPCQSSVFYKNDVVIGGGIIDRVENRDSCRITERDSSNLC